MLIETFLDWLIIDWLPIPPLISLHFGGFWAIFQTMSDKLCLYFDKTCILRLCMYCIKVMVIEISLHWSKINQSIGKWQNLCMWLSWKRCIVERNGWKFGPSGLHAKHTPVRCGRKAQNRKSHGWNRRFSPVKLWKYP